MYNKYSAKYLYFYVLKGNYMPFRKNALTKKNKYALPGNFLTFFSDTFNESFPNSFIFLSYIKHSTYSNILFCPTTPIGIKKNLYLKNYKIISAENKMTEMLSFLRFVLMNFNASVS